MMTDFCQSIINVYFIYKEGVTGLDISCIVERTHAIDYGSESFGGLLLFLYDLLLLNEVE